MSKKLRTNDIVNELSAGAFFQPREASKEPAESRKNSTASSPASTKASSLDSSSDSLLAITPASPRDSSKASRLASKAANEQASLPEQLANSDDLVDAVYRVVRRPGKDTGFVRMSAAEKSPLADLATAINQQHGWKVTETEL